MAVAVHGTTMCTKSATTRFSRCLPPGWAILTLLAALSGPLRGADPDAPAEFRAYETGPLTVEDYLAEVPSPRVLDAATTTELRYEFQFQTRASGRRTTVWTTHIHVEAVVIPAQSWNASLADSRLLDHEQGHFDLTQAAALRARLHLARLGRLSSVAASSEVALANLRQQLERLLEDFQQELLAEHHRYDRATRHGLVRAAQQEHRQEQQRQLSALTAELQGLQETARPRSPAGADR